ncbi:hypothetical protein ANN_14429 [Periplaneta americana]|uniref:Uncharacterized protein n=1 Tax=Periplaneta americana TaxID=6978 RepID=A0ABQ8SXD2_PERAM|nr:hypothetical protein ANN_14429 [Periplaneta americana]
MAGLCEGGSKPPGSLKASNSSNSKYSGTPQIDTAMVRVRDETIELHADLWLRKQERTVQWACYKVSPFRHGKSAATAG